MISVASTGGTVTNFSPRFSFGGMTGTFPANVQAGAKAVSGTSGPARINAVAGAGATLPAAGTGSFALPWTAQSGPIRYAPMQKYPGTKITAKTKTPLNPTSPYTVATTYLPPPTAISTQTLPVTWSFTQVENTVRFVKKRWHSTKLII
jgi:hypothetical protein